MKRWKTKKQIEQEYAINSYPEIMLLTEIRDELIKLNAQKSSNKN